MTPYRANATSQMILLQLLCSILLGSTAGRYALAQQNQPMHLSLDQAIDLAIKQNHSVHLRSLAVDDMRSKKDEERSHYLPQMTTTGGIHHVTELAGVEIPAGAFGNFPTTGPVPAKSLFIDQGTSTTYFGAVNLEQPVTQLFRIHEANAAAKQDLLIAQTQFEQTQDEVALKTRQLFYGILINARQLDAAQEQMEAARVKDDEAKRDVEHGNALDIAAIQSKASILDAQQKSLSLKLQGEDLRRQLANLLGLPVDTNLALDSNIPSDAIDVPLRAEAIRLALEQNQDIRAARQTLEKAKAGLRASKDAYIPDLTGFSKYSYQSGVSFLEHNFGVFGFNLSYDLFDGGRREAEVRNSKTAVTSAQVTIDKLESEITVEIQAEYDRVEELREMVGVVQQAVEVRTEAARLADREFEQNALLGSARSQAQADLSNATALLLEANLNLSLAEADVKRTLGELPR
jgi:outer membrane protein TolC